MSTNSDTEPEIEPEIEDSLVKPSKKVLLQKGGKAKTEKQIAAWERAQAVRLRKAEIKKEKDDEVAAIRHQNNQLKEQMKKASAPAKKPRVKKAPPPPDTDSSESESESDDYETDTDDSSESEEEVVVYKKRKPKVHRHVMPSSRRMKPEFKENPVDYNSFFI